MFGPAEIADALAHGLREAAARRDAETSPFGIDALEETALHPLLAAGLVSAGFGVRAEARYPADRALRRRSQGQRCDLVASPQGRALRAPDDEPSLFAPVDAVALEDACWIEVKSARVFHADGPNGRYAAELLGAPSEDVVRLMTAPGIRHAHLVVVLFARDEADARRDLAVLDGTLRAEGLPVDTPRIRIIPISDRIGHAAAAIAVFSVGRVDASEGVSWHG